eukprot:scaffold136908_cov31-Tisochrysis_lutea.AAC.1
MSSTASPPSRRARNLSVSSSVQARRTVLLPGVGPTPSCARRRSCPLHRTAPTAHLACIEPKRSPKAPREYVIVRSDPSSVAHRRSTWRSERQ